MAPREPRRAGKNASTTRKTQAQARKQTQAQLADKLVYYERAVQDPEVDAQFIARTFRRLRGRPARALREDFCGTASLCAQWVRQDTRNRAYGIDLDRHTLEWGIQTHIAPLAERAAGITLIQQDVREPVAFKADAVAAFNFSYFVFRTRTELRDYFASIKRGLKKDGILYLDLYGGPETMEEREEKTVYDKFTYVWDQAAFNPITHEVTNYIHFEFPDRSVMHKAFTYHWRLWQIPEVQEIAMEAGFRDCLVYWECTDRASGEGNGVFRISRKGDNAPAFVCYLLCV
ncbi:MAG: class I SAM-dependent methyltransferase [Candidatus Eisenbacteria sp.]|nr:class I SAM-dependent methyltransferase [Candidatus Eisenbacteria bacterium]